MTARETGGLPPSETTDGIDTQTDPTELTLFQLNILAVLEGDPQYGLAIKGDLESYYGTHINHGRLYPNLDDLVDRGLVSKSQRDKRTNEYALTQTAGAVLRNRIAWLREQASPDKSVAEHLAEATGEPVEKFEPDMEEHPIPDDDELEDVEVRTDGGTESLDLDIPDVVNGVKLAEAKLRDHFKATEVQLDTLESDGPVTIRMSFRGFSDLDSALDKVSSVARRLDALPEAESIHCGVNTDGAYDPQADEQDERPAGWLNADIDPDRSPDMEVP